MHSGLAARFCVFYESAALPLEDFRAKRHQRQLGNFKALLPEGDTDNRNAEQHSSKRCLQRQRKPADQQPDDIQQQGTGPAAIADLLPEGEKASLANLKHCIPIGIPTMVRHQSTPVSSQPSPMMHPPNKNQMIFPKQPIPVPPFLIIPIPLFRIRLEITFSF